MKPRLLFVYLPYRFAGYFAQTLVDSRADPCVHAFQLFGCY